MNNRIFEAYIHICLFRRLDPDIFFLLEYPIRIQSITSSKFFDGVGSSCCLSGRTRIYISHHNMLNISHLLRRSHMVSERTTQRPNLRSPQSLTTSMIMIMIMTSTKKMMIMMILMRKIRQNLLAMEECQTDLSIQKGNTIF